MRRALQSRWAVSVFATLAGLLGAGPARAHGGFPEPRRILLPADRPEQIVVVTNFGLILSEDAGATWLFSCEQPLSAYASQYLLGPAPDNRLFAMTATAGIVHSDDDSCSWTPAGGSMTQLMPYAFAVTPADPKRVYAMGAPRADLRAGDRIHISDDGGLTFGDAVFNTPPPNALLTILVAPGQPSTLYATLFSSPENHPILLRSDDAGGNWQAVADLVGSLGTNPFELLAIDPLDENRLYVRILGPFAETLATSVDGGLTFVQSVSIPGKLTAFLQLASGTILVGGIAGTEALGYRSTDDGQSFEPWLGVPHVHALAERNGKLYVAGDHYSDGYMIAESDDEGLTLTPLGGFDRVQGVKGCVTEVCAESCAYHAGINLWPKSVCGPEPTLPDGGAGASSAGGAGHAGAGFVAGAGGDAEAGSDSGGVANASGGAAGEAGAEPAGVVDSTPQLPTPRVVGGSCACDFARSRPAAGWTSLLLVGSLLMCRRRSARTTDSRTRMRPHERR